MELPRALAPWQRFLSAFPDDIAGTLGDFVLRLSLLIGPMRALSSSGLGEPDGYDGLARRGPYERLMISSWALAEAAPEEFLRRVVSSEHMFLQLARQQPAMPKRSVVLFDAGSNQLGAPRLVHLAALILLAQRAEQAGASFEWGFLHAPGEPLQTELSQASLRKLLQGRSSKPLSLENICFWEKQFKAQLEPPEVWLVGASELEGTEKHGWARLLCVEDALDPEASSVRLEVRVLSMERPAQKLVLDSPPEPLAVRILRDPFQATVAQAQKVNLRLSARSSLVFSPDGRKVWGRSVDGSLLTFSVPNSVRALAGTPRAFRPPEGHVVLAVGQFRKQAAVVTQNEQTLWWHNLSKRGGAAHNSEPLTLEALLELPPPEPNAPLQRLGLMRAREALWVGEEDQVFWIAHGNVSRVGPVEARVLAARQGPVDEGWMLVRQTVDGTRLEKMSLLLGSVKFDEIELPLGEVDSLTCAAFIGPYGACPVVALQDGDQARIFYDQKMSISMELPSGTQIIGVTEYGYPSKYVLIVLDPSRTRLLQLEKDHPTKTLATTSSPIVHAVIADSSSDIGYVTESGELGVYSRYAEALVLKVSGEGSA